MAGQKPPEQRLLPWQQYLQHVGKMMALAGVSFLCLAMGSVGILGCLLSILISTDAMWTGTSLVVRLVIGLVFSLILLRIGFSTKEKVETSPPVQPIRRGNVAQLPARESLVRSASEPTPEPQEVLLRAARSDQETPPEQLLRPQAGGSEGDRR